MTEMFDFIVTNYAWILVIVLIILLAIIGGFAEKSLFDSNSKENKSKEDDKTVDLSNMKMSDFFGTTDKGNNQINVNNENINNNVLTNTNNMNSAVIAPVDNGNYNNASVIDNNMSGVVNNNVINNTELTAQVNSANQNAQSNINTNLQLMTNLESKLSNLDKQINDILPKKDLINNDILDEVNDIDIEPSKIKGTKKDLNLNDIELPSIKSTKSKKKDLWK